VHERVRVQGGAYGGGCSFDRHTGLFVFTSYRDPNVLETVRAYDEAANFLRTAPLSDDELTKHIVGVIGQLDAYMLPDTKGYASMVRALTGDDEEFLQRRREEVEAVARHGVVVTLGSPEAIESANAAGAGMQLTKVL
jgi:Zn-dependent M16 (insulinase) family peptidase